MTMALQKAEQVEKDLNGLRLRTKMDLQGVGVSVVLWLVEGCYLMTQNCCPEQILFSIVKQLNPWKYDINWYVILCFL